MVSQIDPSALLVSLFAVIFGIIFIVSSFKIKKQAGNDILKNYSKWLLFSSFAFTLGFLGDISKYFVGENIAESLHHIFLIASIMSLAFASFTLSREMENHGQ